MLPLGMKRKGKIAEYCISMHMYRTENVETIDDFRAEFIESM